MKHKLSMKDSNAKIIPYSLTPEELEVIQEEEGNLKKLIDLAPGQAFVENRGNILKQLFDLREAIEEANKGDMPQLTEQLARLTALANRTDRSGVIGVDLRNPYFAHMRLKEETLIRDIYLGTQLYRSPDGRLQIIDWKRSPIATIYFRYDLGDEYEEEIDNRVFEGEVTVKRILKIVDGQLVKIQQGDLLLLKDTNRNWRRGNIRNALLKGGSGAAIRPENTKVVPPKLGIARSGSPDERKYLPEITALIDSKQFEVITQPETGIVAIQGTAGSGKTTVALHRVAWLHFQDRKRFRSDKMMVMVFNRALANYISLVLPSLGVQNVAIDFFESWISKHRNQIFGSLLPRKYSETTPVTVIRFKKHPVLLEIIKDFISEKKQLFFQQLKKAGIGKQAHGFPFRELEALPLVECLYTLSGWLTGKTLFLNKPFHYGGELLNAVQRLVTDFVDMDKSRKEMVLQFWDMLFSDFDFLTNQFTRLAPGKFTEQEYAEIVEWLKRKYIQREAEQKKGEVNISDVSEKATLDYEDDPILVLFYRLLAGSRIDRTGKVPEYAHLMIDEAQDLCPLELTVLLKACRKPYSLTLAGDINQQLTQHNEFTDWDMVFRYLEVEGQKMSTLRVSYRSTYEIMDFSLSVLGELSTTKNFFATRHGPLVELFGFSSQGELTYQLASHLRELINTEPNASVAIICFDPKQAHLYFELLNTIEVPKLRLIQDQEFSFTAGIDLTDIKQVKGLEFDYVILLDADTVNYPDLPYSRYLLHIGATRAAHQLWIMNYRLHSPILPTSLLKREIR